MQGEGIIFSVFYAIPWLLMFIYTHERVPMGDQRSRFSIETSSWTPPESLRMTVLRSISQTNSG